MMVLERIALRSYLSAHVNRHKDAPGRLEVNPTYVFDLEEQCVN